MDGKREHAATERRNRSSVSAKGAEISEQLFRPFERLRIGSIKPAKPRGVFHAARFQTENDFRKIKPFYLR